MNSLYERFGFKQQNSSMYNALDNRIVEAFNMTFCNLLKKMVNKSKMVWCEWVGETLWTY